MPVRVPKVRVVPMPSIRLGATPFPGAYFPSQWTAEVPREGGVMGKRKKATPLEWHEKATVCTQLMTGSARLLVAFAMLIEAVNNWPL